MVLLVVGLPFGVFAGAVAWSAVRGLRMYKEVRAVACPDNLQPVAVRLDAGRAAVTGRECLSQIAGAPRGCAARASIANGRRRSNCALCGADLSRTSPNDPRPVLMSKDGKTTMEWDQVPPERLLLTLSTHIQICRNCHGSQSRRSVRSELLGFAGLSAAS